jgi:hypothetical protein
VLEGWVLMRENNCFCCGQPESNSGCVLGFRCRCDHNPECPVCKHCTEHHVAACTEGARSEYETSLHALREKYQINIFAPGVVKERTGWFQTTPYGEVID